MALCRLSFTSSAASNWKLPRAPGPRTSESWGLNLRSGQAGPLALYTRSPARQTAPGARESFGHGK